MGKWKYHNDCAGLFYREQGRTEIWCVWLTVEAAIVSIKTLISNYVIQYQIVDVKLSILRLHNNN